jgi:IPT/TIG domain-containing protein
MTRRTRAIHRGRLFAASLLTVCVAGCGGGPTAPSQPEQRNPAPTILSITPSIGSTGGGASIKITGAGLLPGLRVAFGATNVAGSFDTYSGGVFVTTPSHAPGLVDVVVTNVDGQNAVAIGAYTFAAPESFDVDGNWRGVSFAGDDDEPFTFTVVNGAVVSIECATSGCFAQELAQHIAVTGTDSQPQANLPDALGHRHQHDVHDPDSADQ